MPALEDLSGKQFGRLTVVCRTSNAVSRTAWDCTCVCGSTKTVTSNMLKRGNVSSCGCLRKEIAGARFKTHGTGYESREYRSWNAAKKRCYTRSNTAYRNYGLIGVKMCTEWVNSFEQFLSDMGERPEGMTLDRINPFGDYDPSNCRWADRKTQNLNKRKNYTK